jgi:hypothetical protein
LIVSLRWGSPPIPISDAADIGARRGYDQVIVIARKIGQRGGEFVTAWGVDLENLTAANIAANFLKFRVMGMGAALAEPGEQGEVPVGEPAAPNTV